MVHLASAGNVSLIVTAVPRPPVIMIPAIGKLYEILTAMVYFHCTNLNCDYAIIHDFLD